MAAGLYLALAALGDDRTSSLGNENGKSTKSSLIFNTNFSRTISHAARNLNPASTETLIDSILGTSPLWTTAARTLAVTLLLMTGTQQHQKHWHRYRKETQVENPINEQHRTAPRSWPPIRSSRSLVWTLQVESKNTYGIQRHENVDTVARKQNHSRKELERKKEPKLAHIPSQKLTTNTSEAISSEIQLGPLFPTHGQQFLAQWCAWSTSNPEQNPRNFMFQEISKELQGTFSTSCDFVNKRTASLISVRTGPSSGEGDPRRKRKRKRERKRKNIDLATIAAP